MPKSELEAVIQAVRRIHWRPEGLVIYSDCKYVCDGFKAKRWTMKDPGPHRDRWKELGELVAGSEDAIKMVWVKAHVTAEMQMRLKVDAKVLVGNECADALAKNGAGTVKVDLKEEMTLKWAEGVAWRIRRRLLEIQMFMVMEHGEEKEDKERRKKAHKARQQKHKLLKQKAQQGEEERRQEGKTCLEKLHEEYSGEYKGHVYQDMYEKAAKRMRQRDEVEQTGARPALSEEFQNKLLQRWRSKRKAVEEASEAAGRAAKRVREGESRSRSSDSAAVGDAASVQ